jgi:hypothetical protein
VSLRGVAAFRDRLAAAAPTEGITPARSSCRLRRATSETFRNLQELQRPVFTSVTTTPFPSRFNDAGGRRTIRTRRCNVEDAAQTDGPGQLHTDDPLEESEWRRLKT